MTPLGHIISVVAIWTMMLFGLRFAAAAGGWLVPIGIAGWRLARCKEIDKRTCKIRFVRAVDILHLDLNRAITTPWSGTLLFAGSVLIGLSYFFGSSGDAAQLVSRYPETWKSYDIATDAAAAVMSVTGMSFVQAATAQRRTASFLVSGALIATGIGIGVVTL
ncbi:hypothetical protein ASE69_03565 [Sphingomonas sp. Leaf208]|uniref:hypothetical protein n=1 Tax=Sphingomonas sp. Leaf208 TaxID=1735679 RepID=UPI0006F29AFD|nr:hypothetical protein [Sphingomonas sp. Leaf208]KQM56704.1 hypothetical protein ASE69_03565 [Sphingomonas sp. Leaf208]